MTTDDHWNQEHAWAERTPAPSSEPWSGPGESDWAEDLRTGAVHRVQGYSQTQQQSGLGIASLVLSLVAGLMLLIPLAFAVVLAVQNPNLAEDDPRAIGLGCAIVVGMVLAAIAGLLGLIGLFQPDRSRTCAVLGVVFAAIEVCGMSGLLVLGLLFG